MKAAIYGRVSTDRQSELSIEAQFDFCNSFCKQNHWEVYDYYTDFGMSGTSAEKRPSLMRLLADARQGLFDVVVAHKVDRAFRNTRDYENVKYELEKCSVCMAFVETGINDGIQGDFINGLMALMAAQYSRNLSREVKKTIQKNVEAGNFLGGLPPLGYKIVNKKYVIDEKTAPLVREIFRMYASGEASMRQLADYLNARGLVTQKGRPFQVTSMHGILNNEKYMGIYVHNANEYNRFGKRKGKKANDPGKVIRKPGLIPSIVDVETFEKVKKIMESNKKQNSGRHHAKRVYLLSGLIKCGHCGASYVGQSSRNQKGYETLYYTCGGKKRKNGCTANAVRKDWIEEEALKCIVKMCSQLNLRELTEKVNARVKDLMKEQNKEIAAHEKLLAKLKKEEANLIDAISQMGFNRSVHERLLSVQDDVRTEADIIERIKPKLIPVFNEEVISSAFRAVIRDIKTGDPTTSRKAMQSVVESVEVFDDRVIIKIKAGLSESGFARHSQVVPGMVAETGFEPATFGL